MISNWVNNIQIRPREVQTPTTFADLQAIFIRAGEDDTTVKGVGSLHSSSDIIDTDGILVRTDALNRVLALDTSTLKPGRSPATLVRVECGITIRHLNATLDARGLALPNLGSYDGQTIIGAISTSTHGSGIRLGSLASCVESIVLVTEKNVIYQIEPSDGITDPNTFATPGVTLKQDDDWFYSAVVGMGCMGIVYSAVLRVRSRYWLEESRKIRPWLEVKANDFKPGAPAFRDPSIRHYEVLVNPYAVKNDGDRKCLVTRRTELATAPPFSFPDLRAFIPALASSTDVEAVIANLFNHEPGLTPARIADALKLLETNHASGRSWDILLLGEANNVPAYASEIAVPADRCVDVVEAIFDIADGLSKQDPPRFHTGPFALRFVAKSKHYLSPQYGTDSPDDAFFNGTCMIEFPTLVGTWGIEDILLAYEEGLRPFNARFHFGQWNALNGGFSQLEAMYPMLRTWQKVYKTLNPSGTTNNAFTRRCGFDTAP